MTLTPLDEPEVAAVAPQAPRDDSFKLTPLDDAPPSFKLTPLDEPATPQPRGTQLQEMKGDLPAPEIPVQYNPLLAAGGKQVGSYKLGKVENGLADVHVNINHPTTNETESDVLKVPYVTDDMLAAEQKKAHDELAMGQKRAERLRNSADPSLGAIAAQSQDAFNREAAIRAQQLSGPNAKSFLQNEQIHKQFQSSPTGKKFEEWHPGEDLMRGFAGLETGLNYAYQSTFGTPEAEKQAREAVTSVPEAYPGTATTNPLLQGVRGGTEMFGQLPLIANPAGAAVLGVSTYGQTVAETMNAADAAEAQAKTFDSSNPEMAQQFRELAQTMRSDAKIHGALSGATMVLAGKLLPEAKSLLGGVARGSAEWAGINTIQDTLNQQLSGTAPRPESTLEGAVAGAAFGAGGHVAGKAVDTLLPHKTEALEKLSKVEQADQEFTKKIQVSQEIINEAAKDPNTTNAAQAAAEVLTNEIPKAHEEQKQEITDALTPLAEAASQPPETPIEEPKSDAQAIRSDEGQVQEGGAVQEGGGGEGGENLQRPPQEGTEARGTGEQIVSATYTDDNGVVHEGVNHVEAAQKAGVEAPNQRRLRETPEYGFMVQSADGTKRVVSRPEALALAQANGQLMEGAKPARGRLHSDQVEFAPETPQEASEPQSATETPPEPPKPPEAPTGGQEKPSGEFPSPMASKNADVEAAAEAAGLPKELKGESIKFKEEFAKAKAKLDADPLAGEKLVDRLDEEGGTIDHQSQALLTHEFIRITNGLKATDSVLDNPNSTPTERADALLASQYWNERFSKTQHVNRKAGTASSLALLARKIGLYDDFSYAGVLKRMMRAAGDPTDPEKAKDIRKQAKTFSDALTEIQKKEAELEKQGNDTDLQKSHEVISQLKEEAAKAPKSKKRITKADIDKKIRDFFAAKPKISSSRPEAAKTGLPEVTTAHQNAAVEILKRTEIGRKILRDLIIVPDWERAISHKEFEGREFTTAEREAIKTSEGFFDPVTGKSVVIRDNVRSRGVETPVDAVLRVARHERMGHEGLDALRELDPKFDKQYRDIVANIPTEELDKIKLRYGNDPELAVREWFAEEFGKRDPNDIPDPKTTLGKIWQAIKDFLERLLGKSTKLDQQVRDLIGVVARHPEALESRRGFGDVMASKGLKFITPEQDRAYADAVAKGDTETAQRMVDEAAKAAGYTIGPVFHGTKGSKKGQFPFTEFDTRRIGNLTRDAETPIGSYFAEEPKYAEGAAQYASNMGRSGKPVVGKFYLRGDVERTPGVETAVEYVAKDPSQIKSADPITRDANGNVIPLSERFNPQSNDIRFSLPEPKEEEGNRKFSELPYSILKEIAKFHVQEGLKKEGIEATHELASKMRETLEPHFPGVTEEQIHQKFSRYGERKPKTRDEIEKQLSDYRGQMRLLSQLKDAKAGKMPETTGQLRENPSQAYRELDKEVRDEIQSKGLHRGTDDEHRASLLDAKKTRLNNAIEDTQKHLDDLKANREKESKTRNVVKNDKDAQDLEDKLKELRKERDQVVKDREAFTPITPEEYQKAIDRRMKQAQDAITEMQRRIRENDFEKPAKKLPQTSKELEKIQIEKGRVRQNLENAIYKHQQSLRTGSQKFWDGAIRAKRAFLLSSVTVFGKLFAAVHARALTTTLEEMINHGIHAVAPEGLTSKAKLEGQGDVSGYAKAYVKAFSKWMDDAKDIWKSGKTDIDVLHGKYRGERDEGWDSLLGKLHYIMKAPAKRAAFEHAQGKLTDAAIRDGLNPMDDDVKARITAGAYKAGERAIFMQDNAVVNAFRAAVSVLEKYGDKNNSAGAKGLSRAMRILFPIVKVPTNMAAEALQYAGGVPVGLVKLAKAWNKGFEHLKPEEADIIMRELKKGSIGTALMALGFLASGSVGGYWQEHEKRKLGEPGPGGVKIGGIDVPSWLMHSPAFAALQMGATFRRVAESHAKSGEQNGKFWGATAALYGMLSETPFINEMTRLGNLNSQRGREQWMGDVLKAQIEPQILQQAAKLTDSGPPRKAESIGENLMLGIPGAREKVGIAIKDALPPSEAGKAPKVLEDYAQGGGHMPGPPQQNELKKRNPSLTKQQWERYAEVRGQFVKRMLLYEVSQLKRMDPDAQRLAVTAISKDASDRAKRQLNLR